MFNLDEPEAALYTQNHVSGGFLLHVESGVGRECFLERMRLVKVSDVFVRNRINAVLMSGMQSVRSRSRSRMKK